MNAMLEQVSPQSALQNFDAIAKASSEMISTDIPGSEVDRFISLALKAKGQKISTLSLVPPMINTAEPDVDLIQAKVASTIDAAEGTAPKPAKVKKATSDQSTTGGSLGTLSDGYAANQSEDLDATC